MRTWPVFHAFERVRFADLVLLVVLRVGFVLIQVGIGFVALRLFHIAVPLAEVALYEPMVIFIRSIPLSVSGLGTTQVAMRDFYEAYASVPLIDAYSTATIFLYLASRLLIATRYVKRVMAELRVPVTEV
jgi:hypothetical protein